VTRPEGSGGDKILCRTRSTRSRRDGDGTREFDGFARWKRVGLSMTS
jgi:hypothetical protein